MYGTGTSYAGRKQHAAGGTSWDGDWRDYNIQIEAGASEAAGGWLCLRFAVNTDVWARVNSIEASFNAILEYGPATIKIRVYDFDPTVYAGIPTGEKWSTTTTVSNHYLSFTASNLNISASYIYVFITFATSSTAYYPPRLQIININGNTTFVVTGTEQPLQLTVAYGSVKTGETQGIGISNRAGRALTVLLKYGNILLWSGNISSSYTWNNITFSCDKTWFDTAGVTTLQSITLTASVQDHSGTVSFTLVAGDDMKPTVDSVATTCVQPAPASTHYPSTYLAGISKVKIEAAVTKNTNAAINTVIAAISTGESVTLTYNSTTEKYEGTSAYPVADNFTVTVTATDVRQMSGSKISSSVTVTQYVKPAINIDLAGTIRCDDQGQETSGGAYYRAKATATVYTGLSGNQIVSFTVKEENAATATAITSGTQSGIIQTGVAPANRMTIVFTVTDYVGYSSEKTYIFDGSRVWMMWETPASGNGLNIGIGKRPEIILNGISTVDVDVNNGTNAAVLGYLLEGINAGAFPMTADADLTGASFSKDFLNVDASARIRAENAAEWFTKPSSDSAWSGFPATMSGTEWRGLRVVFIIGSSSAMVMVLEAYPTPGRLWFRYKASSTWTSWYQLTPTT